MKAVCFSSFILGILGALALFSCSSEVKEADYSVFEQRDYVYGDEDNIEKETHREEGDYLFVFYFCGQSIPTANNNLVSQLKTNKSQIPYAIGDILRAKAQNEELYGEVACVSLYGDSEDIYIETISTTTPATTRYKDLSWLHYSAGYLEGKPRNMGSGELLEDFLCWVRDHYDYKNTIICLSDHGTGAYNETPSYSSSASRYICVTNGYQDGFGLTSAVIRKAFSASGFTGASKPLLIWEDTCLQSSIEILYDLKGVAHYFLSSSNLAFDHDYEKVITNFKKTSTIEQIGSAIVDDYIDYFVENPTIYMTRPYNSKETSGAYHFTQTFARLEGTDGADLLGEVASAFSTLSDCILTDSRARNIAKTFMSATSTYGLTYSGTFAYYTDLALFAKQLASYSAVAAATKEAAAEVNEALLDVVIHARAWHGSTVEYEQLPSVGGGTRTKAVKESNLGNTDSTPLGVTITSSYKKTSSYTNSRYKDSSGFGETNKWGEVLFTLFGDRQE